MLSIEQDENWNKEIFPGSTPRGFKQIEDRLLKFNLVAYSNRNTYIYLIASKSWSVFVSPESQIQICAVIGSENSTVNYLSACIPYVNFLQKNAVKIKSIPTSICIGTRRLAIYINEDADTLHLEPCSNIVPLAQDVDDRVGDFCVMPCMYDVLPTTWSPGGNIKILNYIDPLYIDKLDISTLCWLIGNAFVDPSSTSKFIMLAGAGGTGKSTIISIIEDVLKGCCGTLKSSTLTDIKQDVSLDAAKTIASNRLLTAGDIDLETHKLNLHIIKELTGHDSIAVPPLKVATHCSVIVASNNLPSIRVQPSWCSSAISRRSVVLLMNVNTILLPKKSVPDDVSDNIDFLMYCVWTYLNHQFMPISIKNLMYTLLGNCVSEISTSVDITDSATDQEVLDANTQLNLYFGLPLHTLGNMARLISPMLVTTIYDCTVIKNIKLVKDLNTN